MKKAFLFSVVLHTSLLFLWIFLEQQHTLRTFNTENLSNTPPSSLEVKTYTEKDFQNRLAQALDKNKKPERQIVQSDEQLKSPSAPIEKENEKVFLSKHHQVVDQNTRAAKVGKFKNVLNEGTQYSADKVKNLFTLTPNPKDLDQQKALTTNTGRLRSPASIPALNHEATHGNGQSATDDYLEDIAIGANTLLNTHEFKFYSFYERIREKLSHQWHQRLDHEIGLIFSNGKNLNGDQRTKIQVRLGKDGRILGLRVLRGSEHDELDRAATQAFHLAAPFPNPPEGMIDENNEVSISWDFVVVAQQNSGIRVEVRQGY